MYYKNPNQVLMDPGGYGSHVQELEIFQIPVIYPVQV